MNERRSNRGDDPLDLQRLPVFTPDAGLWLRVLAGQRRQRHLQRWQRGSACAAAAVFAFAAITLLPHPQVPVQVNVAAIQRESQALESQWLHVTNASAVQSHDFARVRIIDADLQAAYDHGADVRDIAPLWRQRNDALRGLIAHVQDPETESTPLLTRI